MIHVPFSAHMSGKVSWLMHNSQNMCAFSSADSCTTLSTCAQHCTFSTADSCTLLSTYARQSQLIRAPFLKLVCTLSTADSCTLLSTRARQSQLTHAQFSEHVHIFHSCFMYTSQNMWATSSADLCILLSTCAHHSQLVHVHTP